MNWVEGCLLPKKSKKKKKKKNSELLVLDTKSLENKGLRDIKRNVETIVLGGGEQLKSPTLKKRVCTTSIKQLTLATSRVRHLVGSVDERNST